MTLTGVILAAGLGRRMLPLTARTHKALIPVAGETPLARIVEGMALAGVGEIIVVTGHLADDLRTYLQQRFPGRRFRFIDNARYESTNNIVSLMLALEQLPEGSDVLLSECDLVADPSLFPQACAQRAVNAALVDRYGIGMDGTVVSVAGGMIERVWTSEAQTADFDFRDRHKTLNVYYFTGDFCRNHLLPALTAHVREIGANCFYEQVLALVVEHGQARVRAVSVDGNAWAEIDDANDLEVAAFRFRPEIRREVLDSTFGGYWNHPVDDFAFMHNRYFPPPAFWAQLRAHLPDILARYGSAQDVLDRKLANALGRDGVPVLCLSGLAQVYPVLGELFAGHRVLIPAPSFGEYARVFPQAETYRDGPGIDLADLERKLAGVSLAVIVNPNNPTGTLLRSADVEALIRRHPDILFVVDESFIAFSGEPELAQLPAGRFPRNLLVLQSLGKVTGLSGVRIGAAVGADGELLARIRACLPVWGMSTLAEYVLELLPKYRPALAAALAATRSDREAFRAALAEIPAVCEVYPSGANYLLLRLAVAAQDADRLLDALLIDHGIYVRNVTARFDTGQVMLRVAVCRPEDNARFLVALAAVVRSCT